MAKKPVSTKGASAQDKAAQKWLKKIEKDAWELQNVPDEIKAGPEGAALCMAAVTQDGSVLSYVPEAQMTAELCLAAVKQNAYAIKKVPAALVTSELCMAAVTGNDAYALQYIPEAMRSAEICEAAIIKSGSNLQYVPAALVTEKMCAAAAEQDIGGAFGSIPDRFKTEAICRKAIENNCGDMQYVPEKLLTESFCMAAVKQDSGALEYVPDAVKTEALCLEAVKNDTSTWSDSVLQYVPDKLITEEMCRVAVETKGKKAVSFIPGRFLHLFCDRVSFKAFYHYDGGFWGVRAQGKTLVTWEGTTIGLDGEEEQEELDDEAAAENEAKKRAAEKALGALKADERFYIEAVSVDWRVYFFIPDAELTSAIADAGHFNCEELLSGDDEPVPRTMLTEAVLSSMVKRDMVEFPAMRMLRENAKGLITKAVCEAAVKTKKPSNYEPNFKFIPDAFKTPELCKIALEVEPRVAEYCPESMRSVDFCVKYGQVYAIPDKLWSEETAKDIFKKTGSLCHIREEYLTADFCTEAVKKNWWNIHYVPNTMKTKEICELAAAEFVKSKDEGPFAYDGHGGVLRFIPKNLITADMAKAACARYSLELNQVPEELRTQEMYAAYVRDGHYAITIPDEMWTKEMTAAAVDNEWDMNDIPASLIDEELCIKAVGRDLYSDNRGSGGGYLAIIPEQFRTEKVCLAAFNKPCLKGIVNQPLEFFGSDLNDVPEDLVTPAMCMAAVLHKGDNLQWVPEDLRVKAICDEAVKNCGMALGSVPKELRSAELCALALKNCGNAIADVPVELVTADMWKEAAENIIEGNVTPPPFCNSFKSFCEALLKEKADADLEKLLGEETLSRLASAGLWLVFIPEQMRTEKIWLSFPWFNMDDEDILKSIPKDSNLAFYVKLLLGAEKPARLFRKIPAKAKGEALRKAYYDACSRREKAWEDRYK